MSREQIVRDTAYAIWEAEGKPHGRSQEHWRLAEERVAASLTSPEQEQNAAKPTPVRKTPAAAAAAEPKPRTLRAKKPT